MNTISIILNGQAQQAPSKMTVQELLNAQGYNCNQIAVAINTTFVPRSNYNSHIVIDQDKIDIVSPIQGG